MVYSAIDTFYLSSEQLKSSPSRKDGIDEETETTLRIYGCDLIQESGILLVLPQAVMATGQVLFHRFYCKKSFARFNVKKVAASCVWLASKLEETPRNARQVLIVFHRMECRREKNLPIVVEHLDPSTKKYAELMNDLNTTERHLLKELAFICHVKHPHNFISTYLATLQTPPELTQEAWNLANDSLRTTLCVQFKSQVVACGVIYAAAHRFKVPLPENPPWWKAFDAQKYQIDQVCNILAHMYSLPKPQYIPVVVCPGTPATNIHIITPKSAPAPAPAPPMVNLEPGGALIKAALDKLKDSKKSDDDPKSVPAEEEARDRLKARDHRDRGRDSDRKREREETEKDRDKVKDRGHRSKERAKDSGWHTKKSRHQSSRDRDYHNSSYISMEKNRHRHHSYAYD